MIGEGITGRAMVLALIFLFTLPALHPICYTTQAGPSRAPIEKGPWVITGMETYTEKTILVTGDITVGTGGVLRLTNSSLTMNLTSDHQFRILVTDGGRLVIDGTLVRSANAGMRYSLEIRNATFDCKSTTISNFTSIHVDHATALLEGSKTVDNSATALFAVGSQLNMTHTDLVVSSGTDALDIEDSTVSLVSTKFVPAAGSGHIGINTSGSSVLHIKDGRIYNFTTGILFRGETLNAEDLDLRGALQQGLEQLSGSSFITNSKFIEDQQGIYCLGGHLEVIYSDISAKGSGIYLGPCDAILDHNTIKSSQTGIKAIGASAVLTSNIFSGNSIGLEWSKSKNGTFEKDIFTSNGIGALIKESTVSLSNCSFSAQTTDMQINGSKVTSINSTYDKAGLDPTATLVVEWYLDIFVSDGKGSPVPGATVQLTDQLGTHSNVKTGPDGMVHQMRLVQRQETRYGKNYNSPYLIEAKNGTATGQATVPLISSGSVTITLDVQDLFFREHTLSNLTTEVGIPLTITLVVGSSSGKVTGVELQVLEDDQAYSSKTFDIITDKATVTMNYNPARAGSRNLTFVLDPNDRIQEVDEQNNKLVVTIEVNGSGGGGGGGGSNLPDLKPFGISPNTLTSPVRIAVDVHNAGNVNVTGVVVSLQIDGTEVDRKTIATIPPNSLGRVTYDWSGSQGKHKVKIVVDPDDKVKESDETNNVLETEIDLSSGLTPSSSAASALAALCIGMLILVVVIIIIVIFFMTRSTKSTNPAQYRSQYGQYYQYPSYGYNSTYYPTTYPYYSYGPTTDRQPQPQSGTALCPRCRSTKVRTIEGGKMLCDDCKKVFT